MRKVVDTGCLRENSLCKWLEASRNNQAVISDYVAMEIYQGDAIVNSSSSMRYLSMHPDQILILKSTGTICGLRANSRGLVKRMIDFGQTRQFRRYCAGLKLGNSAVKRTLANHGIAAELQLRRIEEEAGSFRTAVLQLKSEYTDDELRLLRKNEPFTSEMSDKIVRDIFNVSVQLFSGHPAVRALPTFKDLPNSYIFRHAACTYLLALRWISKGGIESLSSRKIRNEIVDSHHVTYATYFDGIMTCDIKVSERYLEARIFLRYLFS